MRLIPSWLSFLSRAPPGETPASEVPPSAPPPDDAGELGVDFTDAHLSGWFMSATGELFEGLPIAAGDVVLDVGCGDGEFARFCANFGAEVILTDIDRSRVMAARESVTNDVESGVHAFVSNSDPLPLADGVASVVLSIEVLEHVIDPRRVLAELVRVGRPGARYLITVPDPVGEHLQEILAPESYFAPPNHVRIIERDEFARMVESAGLVIERRASYGFFWSMWWLLFWVCKVDYPGGSHPILTNWERTWRTLLATDGGLKVKAALDEHLPKSQLILAHKP